MRNFRFKLLGVILAIAAILPTTAKAAALPGGEAEMAIEGAICYAANPGGLGEEVKEGALRSAAEPCGVTVRSRLWELLGEEADEVATRERPYLIPGGMVFGTRLSEAYMTVTDPAECKGLQAGDKIVSVNGKHVKRSKDISKALRDCDGETTELVLERGGKRLTIQVVPKEVGGEYKLGAVLREGAAGIGTVTYIDPRSGDFGGLGHGICDPGTNTPIEMTGGVVTDVVLGGIQRGENGKPGELAGILTDRNRGVIYANTDVGVFGSFSELPRKLDTPLPIAFKNEVKQGEAKIISTLKNGKKMEYKIEIFDIDLSSSNSKSFKIKVTDQALLAMSGGIVRGMSGSPIIQDGKLVGAVTHVLISDPTSGYGIFIENMLSEAKQNALPKAA